MGILFATKDAAGKSLRFELVRGNAWNDDFQLLDQVAGTPIDLTGITGLMMRIRDSVDSADHHLELSLEAGNLVLVDAALGKVGIRVDSAECRSFPANDHRKAVYVTDAVIERTAGEYEAAIGAKVVVHPQITRPFDPA